MFGEGHVGCLRGQVEHVVFRDDVLDGGASDHRPGKVQLQRRELG